MKNYNFHRASIQSKQLETKFNIKNQQAQLDQSKSVNFDSQAQRQQTDNDLLALVKRQLEENQLLRNHIKQLEKKIDEQDRDQEQVLDLVEKQDQQLQMLLNKQQSNDQIINDLSNGNLELNVKLLELNKQLNLYKTTTSNYISTLQTNFCNLRQQSDQLMVRLEVNEQQLNLLENKMSKESQFAKQLQLNKDNEVLLEQLKQRINSQQQTIESIQEKEGDSQRVSQNMFIKQVNQLRANILAVEDYIKQLKFSTNFNHSMMQPNLSQDSFKQFNNTFDL